MTNQEAIDVMFNEWKCIDRNDGIHCDRKCESCDLVMDVEIIREAFNKAISALEKQIPKKPNKIQSQNSENLWNLYCPSCENWIGMWRIGMWNSRLKHVDMHNISNGNICPYCGQAIDWEGE